jgi:hypothetical protein
MGRNVPPKRRLTSNELQYMLLSRHQNAGNKHDVKIPKGSFQNLSQFEYLGTTLKNKNFIQEEIKTRPISGNGCYHSVFSFAI